jgi:hypothetical protein
VTFKPVECVTVSFCVDLDPAICEVSNPAVESFDRCLSTDEVAKTHPLHTTGDEIETRQAHEALKL